MSFSVPSFSLVGNGRWRGARKHRNPRTQSVSGTAEGFGGVSVAEGGAYTGVTPRAHYNRQTREVCKLKRGPRAETHRRSTRLPVVTSEGPVGPLSCSTTVVVASSKEVSVARRPKHRPEGNKGTSDAQRDPPQTTYTWLEKLRGWKSKNDSLVPSTDPHGPRPPPARTRPPWRGRGPVRDGLRSSLRKDLPPSCVPEWKCRQMLDPSTGVEEHGTPGKRGPVGVPETVPA